MLIEEKVIINGKAYIRHTSNNPVNPIVRCGKDRYLEAIDPAGVERTYFEESPTKESNANQEGNENG